MKSENRKIKVLQVLDFLIDYAVILPWSALSNWQRVIVIRVWSSSSPLLFSLIITRRDLNVHNVLTRKLTTSTLNAQSATCSKSIDEALIFFTV